ncbi:hypothetical protein Pmani_040077, partial [Petrolisthes manimaculis]
MLNTNKTAWCDRETDFGLRLYDVWGRICQSRSREVFVWDETTSSGVSDMGEGG